MISRSKRFRHRESTHNAPPTFFRSHMRVLLIPKWTKRLRLSHTVMNSHSQSLSRRKESTYDTQKCLPLKAILWGIKIPLLSFLMVIQVSNYAKCTHLYNIYVFVCVHEK